MWFDELKRMKKQSGKTSQQISDETGIPKSTIDKLFSGKTKEPYLSSTKLIVHCMGFTLDDLDNLENSKQFRLSEHEKKVITAYRDKPNMQPAVDKLLGVDDEEYIPVAVAARSEDNRPVEIKYISKEKLEEIRNAPSVENEEDL